MHLISWVLAHWIFVGLGFTVIYTGWTEVRAWRLRKMIASMREQIVKQAKAIAYLQHDDPIAEKTPTSHFPKAHRESILPHTPWAAPPPPLAPRLEP